MLEPYTKRLNNLDIEKITCFDPDFNFYQNPVQVSAKLCVANVTYHSRELGENAVTMQSNSEGKVVCLSSEWYNIS